MTTLLLTGFEPFGGARHNPSWDAVSALAANPPASGVGAGIRVVARRLPVEFGPLRGLLAQAIEEVRPDVVIATGLAAGRSAVTVERIAINLADARIPDNAGAQPRELEVISGGPAAYWSTLGVSTCVHRGREAGFEVAASLSAGAYVCNAAMYHLLDLTARSPIRAGFVHVPATGEDSMADHDPVAGPATTWSLSAITGALRAIVDGAVEPAPVP